MKKFAVVAVLLMLAVAVMPAMAAPNADDQFVYFPGLDLDTLNGGTGWASAWSKGFGGSMFITNGGLVFPGLLTTGNAVNYNVPSGSGSAAYQRQLQVGYGGNNSVSFFQFLVRPESNFGQWGSFMLNNVEVGLTSNPNKGLIIKDNNLGGSSQFANYSFNAGQTYLITGFISVDNLGQGIMTAYLWANNLAPAVSVSNNLAAAGNWGNVYTDVTLFTSGNYTYDQFLFKDRPNDPVPEAGTMVALGSFLSMGGLFLRRRFAKS